MVSEAEQLRRQFVLFCIVILRQVARKTPRIERLLASPASVFLLHQRRKRAVPRGPQMIDRGPRIG